MFAAVILVTINCKPLSECDSTLTKSIYYYRLIIPLSISLYSLGVHHWLRFMTQSTPSSTWIQMRDVNVYSLLVKIVSLKSGIYPRFGHNCKSHRKSYVSSETRISLDHGMILFVSTIRIVRWICIRHSYIIWHRILSNNKRLISVLIHF